MHVCACQRFPGTPAAWRANAHRYPVNPWHPSSTPSRTWRNAVAWSSNPARSTAARSRRGTTGHSVELKENIKKQWWRSVVTGRDDVVGLDSAIILPRQVWVASGHVAVFNDPLVECLNCHKRHRQDHLQEAYAAKKNLDDPDAVPMTEIVCPDCGTKGAVDRAA